MELSPKSIIFVRKTYIFLHEGTDMCAEVFCGTIYCQLKNYIS